ncbi:MAG TPA: serine/threonine-protein kinase, partial [Polyangiaceae bacterium]
MAEPATRPAESESSFVPLVREGQIVAGKYLVGSLLGVGGMGVVHAARDISLDRKVALKVLLPRLLSSRTAGERFLREARAATRITSEHVVKLLESDTLPDGAPLLVMEYLEGRDLRALLREEGPLPPQRAVDHLLQALQAIAEGHIRGIVHRDVKPSNLFLTERADGTPLIKVLDFGIAKTLESDRAEDFALTSSEDSQLGSPIYMPPEQLRNPKDVDARADIWALGVTLYELISGRQPFRGQSHADLVSQVLNATPAPLEASLALLPEGLSRVVARCLEKQRDRRYGDAAELAVALAPYGSEDARLSLSRITGLLRSRNATPTGMARNFPNDDPTMPVTPEAGLEPPRSAGTSGVRKIATVSGSSRRNRTLGVAAIVVAISSLLWFRGRSPEPRLLAVAPSSTQHTLPSAKTVPTMLQPADIVPVAIPRQPPRQIEGSAAEATLPRAPIPSAHLAVRSAPFQPAATAAVSPPALSSAQVAGAPAAAEVV